MKLFVVTDRKALEKSFKKGKDLDIEFIGTGSLKMLESEAALVYVDIASYPEGKWKSVVKKLVGFKDLRVGLIDSAGKVEDPAAEFHRGIVDYLPKKLLSAPQGLKRFVQAEAFRPLPLPVPTIESDAPFSGGDWSGIEENREYLFGLLFIEFDNINLLKTDLGQAGAAEYSQDFFNYIAEYFAIWDGYLWIRNDFSAIFLFPFNGKKIPFLESSLELILNADILKFTRFRQKAAFRQAVHIGKTLFRKRGNTGDVVSDTINSLFHLGSRWTPKGSLVLTDEVYKFMPASLHPFFKNRGDFEGRKTWQLKDRC